MVSFATAKQKLFKIIGRKCQECGETFGIEVHHKDFNPKNNDISNLKILCQFHHDKAHEKVGWRRNNPKARYPYRIVLDVEDDLHTLIKIKSAKEKRPISKILTELVIRWLKKE